MHALEWLVRSTPCAASLPPSTSASTPQSFEVYRRRLISTQRCHAGIVFSDAANYSCSPVPLALSLTTSALLFFPAAADDIIAAGRAALRGTLRALRAAAQLCRGRGSQVEPQPARRSTASAWGQARQSRASSYITSIPALSDSDDDHAHGQPVHVRCCLPCRAVLCWVDQWPLASHACAATAVTVSGPGDGPCTRSRISARVCKRGPLRVSLSVRLTGVCFWICCSL